MIYILLCRRQVIPVSRGLIVIIRTVLVMRKQRCDLVGIDRALATLLRPQLRKAILHTCSFELIETCLAHSHLRLEVFLSVSLLKQLWAATVHAS